MFAYPLPPSRRLFAIGAAKHFQLSTCSEPPSSNPLAGGTHFNRWQFSSAFARLLHTRLIRSCLSLGLYYPPLPLLCRPRCHPGQLAVRDSHVSSSCQTHDLRYGASGSRSRIRFTAVAAFALRCSIASGYRPEPSSAHHATRAHIQGPLLGCQTLTGNYRLKLSRDPRISAWCRAVQVSPRAPAAFLRPHQPTCRDWVVPFISAHPPMQIHTASR